MCTPTRIIADIFTPFQDYVNSEQETREVKLQQNRIDYDNLKFAFQEIRKIMKDIEKPLREIITILQVIHHAKDIEQGM